MIEPRGPVHKYRFPYAESSAEYFPSCYLLFDYGRLRRFKSEKHAMLNSKIEVLREI